MRESARDLLGSAREMHKKAFEKVIREKGQGASVFGVAALPVLNILTLIFTDFFLTG